MRVRGNGSELEVYSYGPIGGPAVVLIADADMAAVRWSPSLVDLLVDRGFRVVSFDHRDIGKSATSATPYLLPDMANDVVAILSALELQNAGIVGRGMGGTVALHLALRHPSVVRSLVLLGATPGRSDERLPEPDPSLVEEMVSRAWAGPPATRDERIVSLLDLEELLAGTRYQFDEVAEVGRIIQQVDLELQTTDGQVRDSGHGHAVVESDSVLDRLAEIRSPVLVIHGGDDPVYPVGHGEAIAREIGEARLRIIERLGHEVPDTFVAEYGDLIAESMNF